MWLSAAETDAWIRGELASVSSIAPHCTSCNAAGHLWRCCGCQCLLYATACTRGLLFKVQGNLVVLLHSVGPLPGWHISEGGHRHFVATGGACIRGHLQRASDVTTRGQCKSLEQLSLARMAVDVPVSKAQKLQPETRIQKQTKVAIGKKRRVPPIRDCDVLGPVPRGFSRTGVRAASGPAWLFPTQTNK